MKNIFLLSAILLFLGSSCKKDNDLDNNSGDDPVVSIAMDTDSLYIDIFQLSMPSITGSITSADSLRSVKYYILDIYDDFLPLETITNFANPNQHAIDIELDFKEYMAGLKVVVSDCKGNTAEKMVKLCVVDLLRWEPEVVLIPSVDTAVLTISVADTLPIQVRAKSDAGISNIKYYVVEQRNEQLSDILSYSKDFTPTEYKQEICTHTSTCSPYTVAIKIAITNGKGHVKYVEQPVKITDRGVILPQINLLNVNDTIKASLSLASKTTLQVEVFSAAGLSNVCYYEHKTSGDSVLLKNADVNVIKFIDNHVITVSDNTKGFSFIATNSEGAKSYLYKPAAQHNPFHIIVAKDGSGTHSTIKAAFAAIPNNSNNPTVILIKKGTYTEWLILESTKKNVILVGEHVDSSIISYNAASPNLYPTDGSAPKGPSVNGTTGVSEVGTMGSATLHIEAENFYAENLTIRNTAGVSAGQAVALRTTKDKQVFVNCKLLGYQDTHYTHGNGRQYYKKCYIAGTVDFIFGNAAAYFDECTLYCRTPNSGGEVTAGADAAGKYGYVFSNCRVEGDAGAAGKFSLGRPWKDNCHVVFLNTYMSNVIKSKGWDTWSTKSYKYYEYNSSGPGANNTSTRGNNATDPGTFKFLTDSEAAEYTLEEVMKRQPNTAQTVDNWHPSQLINRAESILR